MRKVTLKDLKHRVVVCSMYDEVADSEVLLSREGVFQAWAKIEAKKASMFSKQGYAIQEDRETRTHKITIRHRSDLDISSAAWLYEERLKSPPRWFKVLGEMDPSECGLFMTFDCRLVERSEMAQPPVAIIDDEFAAAALPEGVEL